MGTKRRCGCGALAFEMVDDKFVCKACKPNPEKMERPKPWPAPPEEMPMEIVNTGPGACVCETPKKKKWWEKLMNYVSKGGPPDKCC